VSLLQKLPTESINRIVRTTGRKKVDFGGENTTAKGKERRSRFFLRLLKVQKQKHIILSSSESKCLFSIIIIIIINIVRRRGRKEEQRCRLVGKN